jgi:GNAT superfamily N-acetyltransferase
MKIIDLTENLEPQYLVCLEAWNKDLMEVKFMKENWYRGMKRNGLRVKIALTEQNIAVGMIEYMPIKWSYAEGQDLYIVNCIWVHGYEGKGQDNMQGQGIGKALLQAVEPDVKALGMNGLTVWGISEEFWMNAPWFQKHGYERVDQIDWFVLLWKPFKKDANPPTWIRGKFDQELIPGKVKVTAFFSGQCCSENSVYYNAKRAAHEYGDRVIFEEIDMSQDKNRKKYGIGWRLYVNRENLFTGYPPSYEQIKAKIEEQLIK